MIGRDQAEWVSIENVAKGLGIKKPGVYYYIRKLRIKTRKFQFDPKSYIPIADFETIKAAKDASQSGFR